MGGHVAGSLRTNGIAPRRLGSREKHKPGSRIVRFYAPLVLPMLVVHLAHMQCLALGSSRQAVSRSPRTARRGTLPGKCRTIMTAD